MANKLGSGLRSSGWVRGRRSRYALAGASTALVVAGALTIGGAGAAGADTGSSQGSSSAQSLQVTPHEGSLGVGAIFGVALAGNTSGFARAQSQGVDLGAVGESMQGYNCGSPPNQYVYDAVPTPLSTETGQQGASQGETQSPSKSDYGASEFVLANDDPYSEANTTYAGPLSDPTDAISVSGTRSKAWSGVVDGVSEAGASSDIHSVSLGGGAVVLNGLDWQAIYPISGTSAPTGSFSIGQVLIDGKALADTADLSAVQTAMNDVLGMLGIELELPQSYVQQGVQFVTPLQVEVIPNSNRDSALDPAVMAAQPAYYQVANGLENGFSSDSAPYSSLGAAESTSPGEQLEAALCQSDTPITVADVTIASMDGGGYFNAALGGVNASSSPLQSNPYDLALGSGALSLAGTSQFLPGTAGSPPSVGTASNLATGTSPAAGSGPEAAGASSVAGSSADDQALGARLAGLARGGPLLEVGLGGLALLLLLIEGDRRMMRRAQRMAMAAFDGAHHPEG